MLGIKLQIYAQRFLTTHAATFSTSEFQVTVSTVRRFHTFRFGRNTSGRRLSFTSDTAPRTWTARCGVRKEPDNRPRVVCRGLERAGKHS